ncbi:MAG: 16S rRNA (adenine(1518)-N(6)/adenine(1519)-N(6))-dimethyltransferase RsmA [Chlorobi bacterium]|nr:16S rRNA (adenine(1518)-N(6)/adenine(1519)-N(6))-dimethyltransferase RsmA [Chlorobiota bacterium]
MINNKPLKRFGQNYLIDKNIVRKIISAIAPKIDDEIIEIGPGNGALTEFVSELTDNFTIVEIDKRKIETLQKSFPNVRIINEDFLKVDLNKFYSGKPIRIIGNIPYNLTSPIIFKSIENHRIIYDAHLMVQYEVAKRMTAKKGEKDYGIFAVLLNYFSEVEFLFKVSPNVFYPKPKVFSAVVRLKFKNEKRVVDDSFFISVVKAAFGNRRKTLKNSLSNSIFVNCVFGNSPVDLSRRAESLTVDEFIQLASYLKSNCNAKSE